MSKSHQEKINEYYKSIAEKPIELSKQLPFTIAPKNTVIYPDSHHTPSKGYTRSTSVDNFN